MNTQQEEIEKKCWKAMDEINSISLLVSTDDEEHIFLNGYHAGYKDAEKGYKTTLTSYKEGLKKDIKTGLIQKPEIDDFDKGYNRALKEVLSLLDTDKS